MGVQPHNVLCNSQYNHAMINIIRLSIFIVFLSCAFISSTRAQDVFSELMKVRNMAAEHYSKENFEAAFKLFNECVRLDADQPECLFLREVCRVQLGVPVDCLNMEKAVALGYKASEEELFFYGCK